MFNYAINTDWLQLYLHDKNSGSLSELYNGKSYYDFKKQSYSSRQFQELWDVYNQDGDHYAVIQRCPFSAIISSDGAIIKLANRELYRNNYAKKLIEFLERHNFEIKSLSRLDVCFDSNTLFNGLKHSTLIKKLMSGDFLKNNQSKVKWHFDAMANIGRPMECNSCSFGSLSSSVSSKMYNKSLELREVKMKPYIVENWQFNGIDVEKDVWRIEISIKADMTHVVRGSTGEIFRLQVYELEQQKQVEDIFYSYAAKYFAFKINDGTKNKTRMKDLQIFPKDRRITFHPTRITYEADSSRSDKIFINKLLKVQSEISNADESFVSAVANVANTFAVGKHLSAYLTQKQYKLAGETLEWLDNLTQFIDKILIIKNKKL